MRRFSAAVLTLYTFPKPVVAVLHGHALAGGCVLALCADWRVLRRGAITGLNEVKVGVPLPFGVALIVRDAVPTNKLTAVALLGRNTSDEEALAAGLADELADADGVEARRPRAPRGVHRQGRVRVRRDQAIPPLARRRAHAREQPAPAPRVARRVVLGRDAGAHRRHRRRAPTRRGKRSE